MEELKDLTEEQKKKIVDEVNAEESLEDSEGNTKLFTMNDIDEKAGEGTAQEQYKKSISANATSLATLQNILNTKDKNYQISRKNLVKLIFATLKLPEEGAHLEFGGTDQQKQVCEFAYAQMQLATNTRAFVLGVNAMREARRAEKLKEEQSKEADNKENK